MRDASLERRIRRRPALVLVGTSWPFPRSRLHYDALPAEVDGALAEGEELALAQPGQASEAKEVAIGLDRIRGELLDIDPVEEPHLGPLPARRAYAKDRLVDDLASLSRAAEDHLQRVEHQLGGPRRAIAKT